MRRGVHRYVERGRVQGVEWMCARSRSPEGIVLCPPLIGGHALQQLRLLRPLARRNLDLLSFSYSGHGASTGAFSIGACLDNSLAALDLAKDFSQSQRVPLFGVASCFAAMPMLHALHKRGEPLRKLVLINAVPHLLWEKLAFDFVRFWREERRWQMTLNGLKSAIRAYRDDLLPQVKHGRQAFGILSRQRVNWPRTVRDLLTCRQLNDQPLSGTPVLAIYGRHDRLLKQIGFSDWSGYESIIKGICPGAEFRQIDGDHFFSGAKLRKRLIETVIKFFSLP